MAPSPGPDLVGMNCREDLREVSLLSRVDPVEGVFIAAGCGVAGDEVRFVIVEVGGFISDAPSSPDGLQYGLMKGDKHGGLIWNYYRAFARHADQADCDSNLYRNLTEFGNLTPRAPFPKYCFIAATHRARW